MHTIRNRRAANPPSVAASNHLSPACEPRKKRKRSMASSQLVAGRPPAFPASISIPPHRGAVASSMAVVVPQVIVAAVTPLATTKAMPATRKVAATKRKARKLARKSKSNAKAKLRNKPQRHQQAAMPACAAGSPALPLPVQAEALVVDPPQPPSAEPTPIAAQSPIAVSTPQPAPRARPAAAAPVQSRALAAHRPDGLLDHIAAWLASRGRAIRQALIGKPRRAPRPKARLQPMAVQKPRRDPRQDELARLRQENRKLQLQLQALLALQELPARPKEPVQ